MLQLISNTNRQFRIDKAKRGQVSLGAMALAACALCVALGLVQGGSLMSERAYADDTAQPSPIVSSSADEQPGMLATQARGSKSGKSSAVAKPSKKKLKAFKTASADFALDLFNRSAKAENYKENVTIAPLSVLTAFTMTANGASGKTAKQMRKVLAQGASVKALDKSLKWYNNKLTDVEKAHISSANAIWYTDDGSLVMKPRFLKANKKYLSADICPADFSASATVDRINSWVSKNTNGMIERIIGELDPSSRIVLANALYFDAEWADPYDDNDVHTEKFTTENGEKHNVEMMHGTEHSYIEGNGATGFIRPYAKGYSYVALLPDEGTTLKSFISSLDGRTFSKLVKKARSVTVNAGVPKYTVEYSNEQMGEQLAAMGMPLAFSPTDADFSKMATDSTGNLFIGQAIHKTKVEVDEQGTKAAAVTAVDVVASSLPIGEVKTVVLDRPFVYAIVDNATKLPVFIGAVADL